MRALSEKSKNRLERLLFAAIVLCAFALEVMAGLKSRIDVAYLPFNGDWQHYNMFRRLLAGQIPFVDFTVVLGQSIMWINSAILLIIGNTFGNSVFATHFTAAMSGFVIFTVFLFVFFRNKLASAGASLGFMALVLNYDAIYSLVSGTPIGTALSWLNDRWEPFNTLYFAGNSSRSLRIAIIYIVIAAEILFFTRDAVRKKIPALPRSTVSALCGALAGLIILWANDYGSSTYVAVSFTFFLCCCKSEKIGQIIKHCLIYIASTLASVFCVMSIVARGNFGVWFNQTFSITGFLWWFDGISFDRKRLLLGDFPPFSGECALPIAVCFAVLCYMIFRFLRAKDFDLFALCHITMLTSFFVFVYLNCLSNGYEEEYTMSFERYAVIFAMWLAWRAVFEVLKRAGKSLSTLTARRLTAAFAAAVVLMGGALSFKTYQWYKDDSRDRTYYTDALGCNVATWYNDLKEAESRLEGYSYFSTYSTALEVMRGEFHVEKYDYITHVFGQPARDEYLAGFRGQDPDYVGIINRSYTRWEAWGCNQNWYFYRELLENYQYDFENTFARYLKKTDKSNRIETAFEISTERVDDTTTVINITCDETEKNLVADVCVAYNAGFTNKRLSNLAVNMLVAVQGGDWYFYPPENFDAWFLPCQSDGYYLPVMIENGRGSITVSTKPDSCTRLCVTAADVLGLYDFNAVFGEVG